MYFIFIVFIVFIVLSYPWRRRVAEREGGWKDRPSELLPPPAVPSPVSSSLAPGSGIPNLGNQ